MSTQSKLPASAHETEPIFSRVLVGIDGSPESQEAARQAALLAGEDGTITLLAAWSLEPPVVAPMGTLPSYGSDELEAKQLAEDVLKAAHAELPSARIVSARGFPAHVLLDEIEREQPTLVALGSHGQGRAAGILVGSTATRLVHDAPCSVLLARPWREAYPRRIAVGVDGSPHSAAAYAVARSLAERFDAELAIVVAEGDKAVDVAGVSLIAGDGFRVIPDDPVPVLRAASADSDLLVVGSRGLHGLKALGSVSERVAHRAECSVLVVR